MKSDKLAQARGRRLHTWTYLKTLDGWRVYRCLVCDYYDVAKGSRTPDPHVPFCPAPRPKFPPPYRPSMRAG